MQCKIDKSREQISQDKNQEPYELRVDDLYKREGILQEVKEINENFLLCWDFSIGAFMNEMEWYDCQYKDS